MIAFPFDKDEIKREENGIRIGSVLHIENDIIVIAKCLQSSTKVKFETDH